MTVKSICTLLKMAKAVQVTVKVKLTVTVTLRAKVYINQLIKEGRSLD